MESAIFQSGRKNNELFVLRQTFALTMNGKKMNIRKNDFLKFAENCDISRLTAARLIESLVRLAPQFLKMCDESPLPEELKERLKKIISERTKKLI